MQRSRLLLLTAVAVLGCSTAEGADSAADPSRVLWQIGKPDNNNAEFALAPGGYSRFQADGFFVVGQSDPQRDWPYVQPGPTDDWAGLRPHTFTVVFGLASSPPGTCRLKLDLLDTQSQAPPLLEIHVNGSVFREQMPPGAGDASVYGQPDRGRRHQCLVTFPASLLTQGNNRIRITTAAGSWLLYDCVTLEGPGGVEAAPVAAMAELQSAHALPGEVDRNGVQVRRIVASVVRAGPPARATFTLDGQLLQTADLASGVQTVDLFVPAVDRVRKAALAMTIEGRTGGGTDLTLTPGVREIVVVFKTHFDIGYTQLAREVVERYRTSMIDKALEVCEAAQGLPPEQRFVWTIPAWPMQQILWNGQTPERRKRIEKAVGEGLLVWHALPFTTHTELLEPEDVIRGLGFASRLSRASGQPLPRDAKMTDVACQAWLLPTLLRHAGVEFLHLGCNAGVAPAQVPLLFWWEGPDGSRLLTMYSVGYGTGLLPPPDWPQRTWLAVIHTGDNHGPPTPEEVKTLLDEAQRKLPGVRVRVGRLSDFADAIVSEKPDLPVVRGDMTDSWIHGLLSDPQGACLARNTRPLIAATEVLNTQLGLWGVAVPDAAPQVAAAYEQSLLYGEHTWGGALYWLTQYSGNVKFHYGDVWKTERAEGRFRRLEESWDEHTGYIRAARNLIMPVLHGQLQSLAGSVQAAGTRIVVYNPLPWRRDGLVRVPDIDLPITALKALDGDGICAAQTSGRELVFIARDLPSLGYRTYVPTDLAAVEPSLRAGLSRPVRPGPQADQREVEFPGAEPGRVAQAKSESIDAGLIESPFFKLILDPARGTVRSLVEKRSGRELIDPQAGWGFGQYVYERFDAKNIAAFVDAFVPTRPEWALVELGKPNLPTADKVPYVAESPDPWELQIERSPVAVAAIFRAKPTARIPHPVTSKFIVYDGLPCLDVEITLHDKPADPWPEAGWLCLPFAVSSPRFLLGRQNSIIDPARDLVAGANRHLFGIHSGLAVLDPQDQGVGLCPLDHPLVSLDRPGCWQYSLDFVPRKPIVFVQLFNNQFTSNFRMWNEGTISSRVRIWAIDRYAPEADLITPSLEARLPPIAAKAAALPGSLPPQQSGLELSRKGVLVTAFLPNPDGAGVILRLWEQAGQDGVCTVQLPAAMRGHTARRCDLRGRPSETRIVIRNGLLDVPLTHFAPTSVLLTPSG